MVTVRCKTKHCQAIGEGKSLEEAIANTDHAIALSRHPQGCVGHPTAEYETVKKNKDDKYDVVSEETSKESKSSTEQKNRK